MTDRSLFEKGNSSNIKWIEGIIYILFALGPLTGNVILVLFGTLSTEFHVTPAEVSIAIPAFMFPFAIIQLFSGALSDVRGRVPIILIGLIIFGISMTIGIFSFSLPIFLLANFLAGVGFGFVNPVLIALMTDISPGSKIPKKMGLLGAVANLGVGVGPLIAGIISLFNWRLLYVIFLIITIIGFIGMFRIRGSHMIRSERENLRLFYARLKSELGNFSSILMIFSTFLIAFTFLATTIWTSRVFAQSIPESITGLVIGSVGIFGAITGVFIGSIIKKKGIYYALVIGVVALFVGLFVLLALGNITDFSLIGYVTIGLILIGVSGGALLPSVMYYSQIQSREKRGVLAGLATAGQFIGIALVPIIYEPFFTIGGIRLVYFCIVILGIVLTITLGFLFKKVPR
ncbi:MAG: MFS transporter [Candidatus Lokiarchaeota archaeon]